MRVEGLQQAPYSTSMMGVVKGALDYYGIQCTAGAAFVLSGHAFVINIHEALCPSGPYCWSFDRFFSLLRNLGIEVQALGTLMPDADPGEKARLEARLRDELDRGAVCSLLNLDNQLLTGYDDNGFDMAEPWCGNVASTPPRLSFGTWREYRAGPPLTFFKFAPCQAASDSPICDALDFALDLWERPEHFAAPDYGLGARAYGNWIGAIDAGHGSDHGNWWNGVVWGECRERATDYFQELAGAEAPGPVPREQAGWLETEYRTIARLLQMASDKTRSASDKRSHLERAAAHESGCIDRISEIRGR